jgi:23S rRNA pseudouridine1911/1915/1917 synthase
MVTDKTLAVTAAEAGNRLDKFLAAKLDALTRSQIKKLIEAGHVQVNGKAPSVHRFLKEGDTVFLSEAPMKSDDDTTEPKEHAPFPEIPVLAETPDYVIINKPSGVLVHATGADKNETTLADWIRNRYPGIESVGQHERPGIVHRLDRDTSGVMVVAKTAAMYDHLKKQFTDRLVKKTYLTLLHGHVRDDEGEINHPIGRSRNKQRMAARPIDTYATDRPALTRYEVVKRFRKPFTLAHAYPLTGRTHQIRVHFMALGFPVVGDQIYIVKKQRSKIELGRHFLHAESLTFTNLSGESITFEAPLPAELQQYLDKLV